MQEYGYIHGREEGKKELVKIMNKKGLSVKQIAEMLDIKTSEIEEMLK